MPLENRAGRPLRGPASNSTPIKSGATLSPADDIADRLTVTAAKKSDLSVQSFRRRVIEEALASESAYWRRRAERFDAARPKFGDFHGRTTRADLRARDERLRETTVACRARASVASYGEAVADV